MPKSHLKRCIVLLGIQILLSVAQRNAQEEAICQPFLTSPRTSPLVPNLRRNLQQDEDGEFACELVLQDSQLPVQIRATVHEGLGWLAIRHIQMGLQRQSVAFRHFRLLAELAPQDFNFSYRAGTFALEPQVADAPNALKYLHNALYGAAATTTTTTSDQRYNLRRLYIKALARTSDDDFRRYCQNDDGSDLTQKTASNLERTRQELRNLLKEFPHDFESAALLNDYENGVSSNNTARSSLSIENVEKEIDQLGELYNFISKHAQNEYAGFTIPLPANDDDDDDDDDDRSAARPTPRTGTTTGGTPGRGHTAWQPQRFDRLLDASEFLAFVRRREPCIISLGSSAALAAALGWNTPQWSKRAGEDGGGGGGSEDAYAYLKEKVGSEEEVLVESRPVFFSSSPAFNSTASTSASASASGSTSGIASSSNSNNNSRSAGTGSRFGFGLQTQRRMIPFKQVLDQDFTQLSPSAAADSNSPNGHHMHTYESLYVNIQLPQPLQSSSSNKSMDIERYRTPLHLLKEDIKPPPMLSGVWENITEINLWMGRTPDATSASTSRMHFDATDNLYVVLEGFKHFSLLSPVSATVTTATTTTTTTEQQQQQQQQQQLPHTARMVPTVRTISPTFAVSPDGLSFQFSVNKFRDYVHKRRQEKEQSEGSSTSKNTNTSSSSSSSSSSSTSISVLDGSSMEPEVVRSASNTSEFALLKLLRQLEDQQHDAQLHEANYHFATADYFQNSNQRTNSDEIAPVAMDGGLPVDHINREGTVISTKSGGSGGGGVNRAEAQFELHAGDMLYLPTGWFHQVTSSSSSSSQQQQQQQGAPGSPAAAAGSPHMAINYWWRALHWREATQYEHTQRDKLFQKLYEHMMHEQ